MLFIPNIPHKIILLVDNLTPDQKLGITTDPMKFDYNINQLDKDVKANMEMRLPLVEEKMVTITSVGRYILIFELDKTLGTKSMIFFDFEPKLPLQNIKDSLDKQFSKNIAMEFLRIQKLMANGFEKEQDIVHLHQIDESLDDINFN